MSQHDFHIENQEAAPARADINDALVALASTSSGTSSPPITFGGMLWADFGSAKLKLRNSANTGWLQIGHLDSGNNLFKIKEDTEVENNSGVNKGYLGPQPQATWNAGVGTNETLISPLKLATAIQSQTSGGSLLSNLAYAKMDDVTIATPTTTIASGFSSISRVSSGTYDFTFDTARGSIDYVVSLTGHAIGFFWISNETTTGFRVNTRDTTPSVSDISFDITVQTNT